jgi:hypothetical protein
LERRIKKARRVRRAIRATTPITMPAIAPGERLVEEAGAREDVGDELVVGVGVMPVWGVMDGEAVDVEVVVVAKSAAW